MIGWEKLHKLLELILVPIPARCEKFLNNLEHRHDVSFLRLTEFRDEENGRRDQTFCGIVEVAVLTEAARFHAGENDGLGDDLGVLFRLGFVLYFIRPGIQIHVLVDKVQKVVSVRAHGIAQVNDRNVIAIILGGDRAVVAHDVTFGIG